MIFMISVILQTIVVLFILWLMHRIFWTIANTIRAMLYYWFSFDTFTNDEKIELKITEVNQTEAVVINPDEKSSDQYWDEVNDRYDVQFKQNQFNPDEILFQGRIKRRR